MTTTTIDLNCDLGESFGAYSLGQDEDILPLVSSANIACGYHAGDPATMKRTVRQALRHGVALGAHPGLPDLAGFGRREMAVSPEEVYDMTVYQIGSLLGFVRAEGSTLHHVKPHGALYNMAAASPTLAEALAEAVYRVAPEACLYGLAGSALPQAAEKLGLRAAHEVFADRSYQPDGTLTPRRQPGALLTDPAAAEAQVLRLVREGRVRALSGDDVLLRADTVCLHGDGPHALDFARRLRAALAAADVAVHAPGGLRA